MSKNLNIIAQNNGKNIFLFCILQRELHVYSSFEENSRHRYLFVKRRLQRHLLSKWKTSFPPNALFLRALAMKEKFCTYLGIFFILNIFLNFQLGQNLQIKPVCYRKQNNPWSRWCYDRSTICGSLHWNLWIYWCLSHFDHLWNYPLFGAGRGRGQYFHFSTNLSTWYPKTFRFVNFLIPTLISSQTNKLIPICYWTTFYFEAYEFFKMVFFHRTLFFSKSTGLWFFF